MSDETDNAATETAAPEPSIEEIAARVFGNSVSEGEPVESPAPEVAPEPAKAPEAERVSARIIAAKRADMRAAQARAEIAAQRAELEKRRAEVEEQAKVVDALREAKLSPSKALEILGMSPKEFLETLANEHEPEVVAKRAMSSALTETEKLRVELAELKRAMAEREREQQNATVEAGAAQAKEAFLEHVSSKAEAYPHTVEEFTPEEIVSLGWKLASEHARPYFERFGVYPDDEVIAEELERQAKQRAEQRTAWRSRIGGNANQPSKGTTGQQRATQSGTGPSPRTLTSRLASEKATAAPKWSQEQADEESLRILNAALKHTG